MPTAERLSSPDIGSNGDCTPQLDRFKASMDRAEDYPTNLISRNIYSYQLNEYLRQTEINRSRLFGPSSTVDFLEFRNGAKGLAARLRSKSELSKVDMCDASSYVEDPLCRFMFISAPSSRDRLNVEHNVLMHMLTWHQVMPEILDFLLVFGVSENPKDFQYTGFRSALTLSNDDRMLAIPNLGRSGREIRLCHILRSAEPIDQSGEIARFWPWALRPTVTYHAFDVESERSVWLIIKANALLKHRVRADCRENGLYRSPADGDASNSFESTLRTHLVICAWAGQNWRWYINFMEEKAQWLTRGTLTESLNQNSTGGNGKPRSRFSFRHLQEVHFMEEKANEALLVLRGNMSVIKELCALYTSVAGVLTTEPECAKLSPSALGDFQRYINITITELTTQESRLRMLLQILADRKVLLQSMLQWDNSQHSIAVAMSTGNMAEMTELTARISQKTIEEASHMRIITWVTLFFLPGTFVSTLMSTPIVRYPDHSEVVNVKALELFLAVALPLLVATLFAWYCLVLWHNYRRKSREQEEGQAKTTNQSSIT